MKQKSKKSYWLLWSLSAFLLVPLAVVLVLSVVFWLGAPSKSQLEPPPDLIRPRTGTSTAAAPPISNYDSFEATLEGHAEPSAIAIYQRFDVHWLEDHQQTLLNIMAGWRPGEPLTPELRHWLAAHSDMIVDLVELGRLGGLPGLEVNDVERLIERDDVTYSQLAGLPVPNFLYLQNIGRVLCAEARRLREAGDADGAAEALLANWQIARSVRQPFTINHVVGLAMQNQAMAELESWLAENPPPADTARRLRDVLAAQEFTMDQLEALQALMRRYRYRVFESNYEEARAQLLVTLGQPAHDLFGQHLVPKLPPPYNGFHFSYSRVLDAIWDQPSKTLGAISTSALQTIGLKARAGARVEQFDGGWRSFLAQRDHWLDQSLNLRFEPVIQLGDHAGFPVLDETPSEERSGQPDPERRTQETSARLRQVLGSLDRLISTEQ